MEIANVIVTHPDNGVVSVDSFAVNRYLIFADISYVSVKENKPVQPIIFAHHTVKS